MQTFSPCLPILRWARDSEMTADNAGLICAQDEKASEQVLLRLETGVDDSAGRLNGEAYLHQCETEHLSDFSKAVLLWMNGTNQHLPRPLEFTNCSNLASRCGISHCGDDLRRIGEWNGPVYQCEVAQWCGAGNAHRNAHLPPRERVDLTYAVGFASP